MIVPSLLGSGERFDIDSLADTHTCRFTPTKTIVHAEIPRRSNTTSGPTD
ncbi:hypothetical protein BH23ACT9_BH23ACT9_17210 [soil metagenome]